MPTKLNFFEVRAIARKFGCKRCVFLPHSAAWEMWSDLVVVLPEVAKQGASELASAIAECDGFSGQIGNRPPKERRKKFGDDLRDALFEMACTKPFEDRGAPAPPEILYPLDRAQRKQLNMFKASYAPHHAYVEFEMGFTGGMQNRGKNPFGVNNPNADRWEYGYAAARNWRAGLRRRTPR